LRPRFQYRLRTLLFSIAGVSLALAYLGSYHRLSRRGMREARIISLLGFLYVSLEEVAVSKGDLARHHRLATFYSPLNWLDHHLFGSETPTLHAHWRIGK
jgi:hypothetical protein